jgi:hypothetical protein
MNTEQIMHYFSEEKIGVIIYGGPKYVYPAQKGHTYRVQLEKMTDGTELKVDKAGPTFADAVLVAYEAWTSIVNKGIPEFRGQLLEMPTNEELERMAQEDAARPVNPEIPF